MLVIPSLILAHLVMKPPGSPRISGFFHNHPGATALKRGVKAAQRSIEQYLGIQPS